MTSLLDGLSFGELPTGSAQGSPLEQAMRQYFQYKVISSVTGALVTAQNDDYLARKDRMLSIMEKQKKLGLPVSNAEYDRINLEDKSFFSHAVRQSAKRGLQAIGPKYTPFSEAPKPLFDVAKSLSSALPSFQNIPKLGRGGRYAAIFGGLRTAFR